MGTGPAAKCSRGIPFPQCGGLGRYILFTCYGSCDSHVVIRKYFDGGIVSRKHFVYDDRFGDDSSFFRALADRSGAER